MIDIAKQVWLLADHTKNGKVSFAQFADLSQIEHLIVDDKVPRDTLKEIEEAGICVSVVSL